MLNFKTLTKKIILSLTAGICGIALTFSASPMPNVNASILGDVLGTVIVGNAAIDKAMAQIKYLNNTEEGRQAYFEGMKDEDGVNYDEELNNRLDTIMSNVSTAIASVDPTINDRPYNYFLNQDTAFNAYCTIGHNVSVNTGVFSVVANDDELAVILAHEMGHGQKDHPLQGYKKALRMGLFGSILSASTGGTALGQIAIGNLVKVGRTLQVTRPQEWEADNLAFDYITHSSYNPGACAAIWQRDFELKGDTSNSDKDHAGNLQRRDNYVKKLYEYSGKHVTAKDGKVQVNGKDFVSPVSAGGMSAAERSYFVLGNLVAAYHSGQNKNNASVSENGTVMIGAQPIMTPAEGDPSAADLTALLNKIK